MNKMPFSFIEKIWLKVGRAQNAILDAEKIIKYTQAGKKYLKSDRSRALTCLKHLSASKKELSLAMSFLSSKVKDQAESQIEIFKIDETEKNQDKII